MHKMKFAFLFCVNELFEIPSVACHCDPESMELLANALVPLGFLRDNIVLIQESRASRSQLRFGLKKCLRQIQAGDEMHFFIWSPLQELNSGPVFTCCDTIPGEVAETGVEASEIIELLSECDGSLAVWAFCPSPRKLKTHFENEFQGLISKRSVATHVVIGGQDIAGDASNRDTSDEEHTLLSLLQGIAIESERTKSQVQVSWREFCEQLNRQSPYSVEGHSSHPDATVFECSNASNNCRTIEMSFADVILAGFEFTPFKALKNFSSQHRVPTAVDSRSQQFAIRLANEELETRLQSYHRELRNRLGLKRTQIEITGPSDGVGALAADAFSLSITVHQDSESPGVVKWTYELSRLQDLAMLDSDELGGVFDGVFREITVRPSIPIDLEELVDRIEDGDFPNLKLDYDLKLTSCSLRVDGSPAIIGIRNDQITCQFPNGQSIKTLKESLSGLKRLFGVGDEAGSLPTGK
ncbi:MAG: hypothetical protein R3C03_06650 [Pirellulaceae bacterium]